MSSEKNFPAVPTKAEPQTRIFLAFVRSKLIGLLGDGENRAVTWKDLTDLGLVDVKTAKKQMEK